MAVFLTINLAACANVGGLSQSSTETTNKLNAAMLGDLPLPKDARISNEDSLVLGEGDAWVGRVTIYCGLPTNEAVAFFIERYPQAGWTLLSSTKSKVSALVFVNAKKTALLEISEESSLTKSSKIVMTVSPLNSKLVVPKK